MDTLDFLQWVLPTEGHYVTTVINGGGAPQQAFFGTVEELAANCQRADRFGNNTYYAISSFKQRGSRKQENVHLTKVVALDVDCAEDKPYLNQKEGLAALLKFLTATGLPMPMIVSSGRGLHVYWVLEEALAPADWKPLAEAMKAACIALGFNVDHGLTANSALVLRPTGTHNPKNGKEVVALKVAQMCQRSALENKLLSYKQPSTPAPVTQAPTPPTSPPKATGLLASMAVNQEYPPTSPETVVSKCQQVRWAVNNQDKVPEPLWYSMIGVAAHCMNPEETAKAWSQKHPKYSEAETLRKVQQWKANTTGPATCAKIEMDRPKGCDKCPHQDNVSTPASLGRQYAAVDMGVGAPDAIAKELPPPWPFKWTGEKIVQTIDGTDVDICPFAIYPVGYGMDESLGYETVRYKWKRPHVGWQDLMFRQAYLSLGGRDLTTAIADQGIVLQSKKQAEGFQFMLRSYMDELRKTKSMTNIYSTMGWKKNFSQFVLGSKLYRRENDGSVSVEDISLTSNTSRLGHDLYTHRGSAEAWRDATSVLETAGMPYHVFALGQAFAAPLWAFTGLKGVTVSLCGPSGGGKSLIQLWQQSVWGNPEKLHFGAKFTQNALFNRLGMYGHLPMTIDEVTIMDDKAVGEFCYVVTQGHDKARLNRNIEEQVAKEWATSVTVSTNVALSSKMAATGRETDAQMARLLEIAVPPHKLFAKDSTAGRKIFEFITTNYGVIGDAYTKALLRRGKDSIEQYLIEAKDTFNERYDCKFAGSERYWEQDLVLVDAGLRIAMEEGLVACRPEPAIECVLPQLDTLRKAVSENKVDAPDLVNEYLNEVASDALTVMHTVDMPPAVDSTRLPRGIVKARFDVYRKSTMDKFDKGTVMIVQKPFREWVSARGHDYNVVRREIANEGADATPSSKRFNMGKNTALKAGQQYVFGINLCNMRFAAFLDEIEQHVVEDLTLGQLAPVK